MDYLVYAYYVILFVALLWGAKFYGKSTWNDGFMSLTQTKALQGFSAICIMFHHIGQKTCAPWLPKQYIVHGLDIFVNMGYLFVGIFLFCSGYGLYKSFRSKPNYLNGFFGKRVLVLILSYYSTGIIFLIVRFLMKQDMDVPQIIYYITGLQLSNPNSWYVIILPFLYLFFYLSFRLCKKENTAIKLTIFLVFLYVLLGTIVDHNDFWLRGEWWYNSVHFFWIGLLFAKFEKPVVEHVKKHFWLYVVLLIFAIHIFYILSGICQGVFSYYGEDYHLNFKVLRRWVCLISQILASCSFVFFVFLMGLKIKIGNRFLAFMGTITLEFYLIHGLFIELFGYSFVDAAPSIYYIRNVFIFVLVVFIPSIPLAVLLSRFHKWLVGVLTKKKTESAKLP